MIFILLTALCVLSNVSFAESEDIDEKVDERFDQMNKFVQETVDKAMDDSRVNMDYYSADEPVGEKFERLAKKLLKASYVLLDIVSRFVVPLCFGSFLIGFLIFKFVSKTRKLKAFGFTLMIGGPLVFLLVALAPIIEQFFLG